MTDTTAVEVLFEEAVEQFPYKDIAPTSIELGSLEADENGAIDYEQEFVFQVGELLTQPLLAGGWITLRRDDAKSDVWITAYFGVARNGDWEHSRILPDDMAVLGEYDQENGTWSLDIDRC